MKSTGERTTFKDTKDEAAAPCTIAKAYGEPNELGHQGDARRQAMPSAGRLKDFQPACRTGRFKPRLDGYAIKVPVFSFDKFPNVDKSLGPEAAFAFRCGAQRMKSTGEAIYFIKDLKDPFCHCEVRLCGPRQRQVYGERSMYLSR